MQNNLEPVRFSSLKRMALSPAHYAANIELDSPCIENGAAVDALIYGTRSVVAYPGKVRNGKEYDAFMLDHPEPEHIVLTKTGLTTAQNIANAVKADKRAMKLLSGDRQPEINWEFCGRKCISHPDTVGKNNRWIADLKVSQTSNPARFRWHAIKMLYHCQLGFYDDAVRFARNAEPVAHYLVVVEAKAPHVVTTFKITRRAIEAGKKKNRLMMEQLLACESSGFFPGYSQAIEEIDIDDEDALFSSESVPF